MALEALAENPALRGKILMQAAKYQGFDPTRTARAITPLLLDLPDSAVFEISSELDELLSSDVAGLRSAAVALKVRSGAPLLGLADRDPAALIDAVAALPKEQAPESLTDSLIDLIEAGKVSAPDAFAQAIRLSDDTPGLFKRVSELIDAAGDLSFEQWSDEHRLAMAGLGALHRLPDEDWPAGFDAYRIPRADHELLELGREVYHEAEIGCVKCHGAKGQGEEGFPPLAGSPTLLGSPQRAATIVKYGLMGELAHTSNPSDGGKPFNAQMEPLSNLSNAQMAAALTYARQSFGNFAEPVTVEHVASAREPDPDKGEGENMWKANALLAKFPFERDRVLGSIAGPQLKVVQWKPPTGGLFYMLIAVTASMALILVGTWLGGRPPSDGSHGSPAVA